MLSHLRRRKAMVLLFDGEGGADTERELLYIFLILCLAILALSYQKVGSSCPKVQS